MLSRFNFWQHNVYNGIIVGCVLFLILTTLAMVFYPGGTLADPQTAGYSFFTNYFSELGLTNSPSGEANTVSKVLFTISLATAGAALCLFFMAFCQFFWHSPMGTILSGAGTIFGVLSGLSFIGVAFTPVDLSGELHGRFVLLAFRSFMIAVVFYIPATLRERGLPKRFAVVFITFAAVLGIYLVLLTQGPSARTVEGLIIQVTGQKIIAYASIFSITLQAFWARKIRANAI